MRIQKQGLTLVELMVAVAILGLLVMGLMQVYPSCVLLTEQSRHRAMAGNLAQAELDRLFSTPYVQIAAGNTNQAVTIDPVTNLVGNMNTNIITVVQIAGNNDCKVIVTVAWNDHGRPMNEILESIITSYL